MITIYIPKDLEKYNKKYPHQDAKASFIKVIESIYHYFPRVKYLSKKKHKRVQGYTTNPYLEDTTP